MRISVIAVVAMSLGATLAASGIGLTWHHERDQADAVRELTQEVAALRSQLAAPATTCATAAPSAAFSEAALVPSDAGSSAAAPRVPSVVAVAPAVAAPPLVRIEPRVGDGGRPMTAQQEAALTSATELVDAALHRGAISRSAMATLRARIDAAGHSEETDALRAEIADAINQGLVVEERPTAVWH